MVPRHRTRINVASKWGCRASHGAAQNGPERKRVLYPVTYEIYILDADIRSEFRGRGILDKDTQRTTMPTAKKKHVTITATQESRITVSCGQME